MDYYQYYAKQAGGGYPVFQGARFQRGYGLGNIFKGFFRWITPLIKTHALPALSAASKEVGKEALKTIANVSTDTINGKNFNTALKERGSEAINTLAKRGTEAIDSYTNQQKGSGRRKRKSKKTIKQTSKRTKKDIFDNEFLA